MQKLQFYPIDVTYKVIENKPVIYLFGRTIDNRQICVVDEGFQPYFYVFLKDESAIEEFVEKLKIVKLQETDHVSEVVNSEVVAKKFLGKPKKAVKVFTKVPSDIPSIRGAIKDWYVIESTNEYDIPFVRRYLIDKNIIPLTLTAVQGDFVNMKCRVPVFKAEKIEQPTTDAIEKPKILAFDIEVYNPHGKGFFPDKDPIIMISFFGEGLRKVITWKRFDTTLDYVEFVNGESELIEKAKEVITDFKPDILAGYFSDEFDIPYILTRAEKYEINFDIGLDYSELKLKKGAVSRINGIVNVDVFTFISRVLGRNMNTDRYSLRKVSSELLGETKKDVEMDNLAHIWDKEPENLGKYCEYNLHDSYLAYHLCLKIMPNIKELVKIIGLTINDISRMGFSQLVEWYIIKNLKEFNEVAPNKPSYYEVSDRQEQTYKGAFVYEPEPGLFKNIAVFDFRSLYPTIIASHNIGISTLNCECCRGEASLVPLEKGKAWYCKKTKGFLSRLVEDLITRRMRIKEMMKENKGDALLKARSDILKLLANSFYGYMGFFGARWYCLECANAVTAYGRFYITTVIQKAEEAGFKVLYSDTDSIFLALQNKTEDEAKRFIERINSELPGLMELEYESFYAAGIFVSAKEGSSGAKKKYALVDSEGNMKIRGFETIRGNWSPVAKETQEKVLNIILKEDNVEKALKYAKNIVNDLREKKTPKEKVIIHTQIQKELNEYSSITPHVAIARLLRSRGQHIAPGTRIEFIVTPGKGVIRDRVKLPDEAEDYDSDYYINNQVIPAVERIFNVLGYKEEDLVGEKKQSTLGKFF